MSRLRVGLVGAGMVSGFHLAGWRLLGDSVELVAIADPDTASAQMRATQFGLSQVYPSLESMLDGSRLDAVDIMTPPAMHAAHCEVAAAAGVAILCQKPLAPSWEVASQLCERLGNRVRLMVHENWRFRQHYRVLNRWMSEGRIGNFLHGEIDTRSCGLLPDGSGNIPALVRQPLLATLPRMMIAEVLVHHLDIALWLTGADSVTHAGLRFNAHQIVGESAACIHLATADQREVVVAGDMTDAAALPVLRDRVSLFGDRGGIELRGNFLRLLTSNPTLHEFDFDADYRMSYAAAIGHFVDALQSDTDFETPPEWHLRVLEMAEKAYRIQSATVGTAP
jgi:predicted dehydrogenase